MFKAPAGGVGTQNDAETAILWSAVLSCSVVSDSLGPYGLSGSSVYEHSPGKNTGVGCHALL